MDEEEITKGKIAYYDWKNSNDENDEWRQEVEKTGEAKYSFHSAELLEKMDQLGHSPPLQFYVNQNAAYENVSFEDDDDESDSRIIESSHDVISIHFLETIFEETDDDIEEVDSESSEPSYGYGCFDKDDTGSVIYIPINSIEDNKISKEGLSSPSQVAKPQRRKSGQQIWSTSREPAGNDSLSALDDINLQISGNDSRLKLSVDSSGKEKVIKVDSQIESLVTSPLSVEDNYKEASIRANPETSKYKGDARSTENAPTHLFDSSLTTELDKHLGNECNHGCSDEGRNYDKIWIKTDITVKDITMEAGFPDLPKTSGIYENYRFSEKSIEDNEPMMNEGNEVDSENSIYDKIWIDKSEVGISGLLGVLQNEEEECAGKIKSLTKGVLQHTNRKSCTDLEDVRMSFANNVQNQNSGDNFNEADNRCIISELVEGPNSNNTYCTYETDVTQEAENTKTQVQSVIGSGSALMSNFDSLLRNARMENSEYKDLNKACNLLEADEQQEPNPHVKHEDGSEMYCSDMDVSSCEESDEEYVNLTLNDSRCRVRSFASFDDLSTIGIEEEEEDTSKKRLSYSTMLSIVSEGPETEDDDKSPAVASQLASAEKCVSFEEDSEEAKLSLSSVNVALTEHNVNEVWSQFKRANPVPLAKSVPDLLCIGPSCPSNIDKTYPCLSMPNLAEFKFYNGRPKGIPPAKILSNSSLAISNPEEFKPVFKYPSKLLLETGNDKCVPNILDETTSLSEDKQSSRNSKIVKTNNDLVKPLEFKVISNNISLQELPAPSESRSESTDNEEAEDFELRLAKDSMSFSESENINKTNCFDLACNQIDMNCALSLLNSQLARHEDPNPSEIPSANLMLNSFILSDCEHTNLEESNKFVHALPPNVSHGIETNMPHGLLTTVNYLNPDFEENSYRGGLIPLINEETVSENLRSNQFKITGSKKDATSNVCQGFSDEGNEITTRKIDYSDSAKDTEQSNLLQNVIEKSGSQSINEILVPNRKLHIQDKFLDDIKDPINNYSSVPDNQLFIVDESGKRMNTTTEETIECNGEMSQSLESPSKIPVEKRNQAKSNFAKKHQHLTYYTKKYELLEVDLLDSVFETSSLSVNQPLTEKDLVEIGLNSEAAVKSCNLNSVAISDLLNVASPQLYYDVDVQEPIEIRNSENGTASPKHDFTLRNSPMIEHLVSSKQSSSRNSDDQRIVKKDAMKEKKRDFDFAELAEMHEPQNSSRNAPFNSNVTTSSKSKAKKSKIPNKMNESHTGFFERFSVGRLSKKDGLRKGKSLSDNDINKIKPVTYEKTEKQKFSFFNFGRNKKRNSTVNESSDSKLISKIGKNSLFYSNIHPRDELDFSKSKSFSSLSVDAVDTYKSENFNVLRNLTDTISILKETPVNMRPNDKLDSNILSLKKKCDDLSEGGLTHFHPSASPSERKVVHNDENDQTHRNTPLSRNESYLVSDSQLEDVSTSNYIFGVINTPHEHREKHQETIGVQKLNLSPSDNEEILYNKEFEMIVMPTNTMSGNLLQYTLSGSQNSSSNSLTLIEVSDEFDGGNEREVKFPLEARIMSKNSNDGANCLVDTAKFKYHEIKNETRDSVIQISEIQQEDRSERVSAGSPDHSKGQFSRVERQQDGTSFPRSINVTSNHQKSHFPYKREHNSRERVNFPWTEQKTFTETKKEILNYKQIVSLGSKDHTSEETCPGKRPGSNIEILKNQLESSVNKEFYPLDNYLAYGGSVVANMTQDNSVKDNFCMLNVQQVKETKRNYTDSHLPSKLKMKTSSSNRAFLETNLDENIGNCRNFLYDNYDVKAKSMLNLDGFTKSANPTKPSEPVELRSMSVEHLLDESRKSNLEAPENVLQRSANQQPSGYELKVQESLQKLNIPEWYKPNKFRIISPKTKSQPRWSNIQRCQASLEKNIWQNSKGSHDTLSPSSTKSAFCYLNTGSNLLLDSKCVRFGSSRSIQSRSSIFSSERDDLNLMSMSNASYSSERSTPLGRNILPVHKPYLGWRSRESLSVQNVYKTAAERLAESFQSKSHIDLQKSDVKSSIHEVTSAIQDYIHSDPLEYHDKLNKNSHRKPKVWLESSFLGLSTLDLEEDNNVHDFIPKPPDEIILI